VTYTRHDTRLRTGPIENSRLRRTRLRRSRHEIRAHSRTSAQRNIATHGTRDTAREAGQAHTTDTQVTSSQRTHHNIKNARAQRGLSDAAISSSSIQTPRRYRLTLLPAAILVHQRNALVSLQEDPPRGSPSHRHHHTPHPQKTHAAPSKCETHPCLRVTFLA
jgi:hypothetical protein